MEDQVKNMELEKNLRDKITALIFLASQKMDGDLATQSAFFRYKKLVNKVSKKIENWSKNRANVREFFTNDDEFEELDRSPTKFETSGSEEESQVDVTQTSQKSDSQTILLYNKQESQNISRM